MVPIYVFLIGSVSYEAWLCVWWFIPCFVISLLQSCYKLDKNITLYSWLIVLWLVISLGLSLYNKLDKNIYKFFDLTSSLSSPDVLFYFLFLFFIFYFFWLLAKLDGCVFYYLEGELSKKLKLKSISRNFYYLVYMNIVFLITSIILHLLKS